MLRALAVLLMASLAGFAVPAAAEAAPRKCKKGYVLKTVKVKKGGKTRRVKKCVKKAVKQQEQKQNGTQDQQHNQDEQHNQNQDRQHNQNQNENQDQNRQDGIVKTRDDAVAQSVVGGGLFLERADFGSVTATYYRIFLYPSGEFTYSEVDWTSISGERCSKVIRGTWTLKEGGRVSHPTAGTGVYAVVTQAFDGQSGDDLFVFSDTDPKHVWVGPKQVQFEQNPNMRDSC